MDDRVVCMIVSNARSCRMDDRVVCMIVSNARSCRMHDLVECMIVSIGEQVYLVRTQPKPAYKQETLNL